MHVIAILNCQVFTYIIIVQISLHVFNAASISPAIELIFVNNTPVMGEDSVYVEFESSPRLPGLLMQCHITRLDNDVKDDCETLCNVPAYVYSDVGVLYEQSFEGTNCM